MTEERAASLVSQREKIGQDFTRHGILVFDKPSGMTSFDVVALVRRITGMKRVGHGGTLDPMATGVLPVFTGNATRVIEYMHEKSNPQAKIYEATMLLGISTDTQDTTGEILSQSSLIPQDAQDVVNALRHFVGEIEQIPPKYSAIKYKGRKLYDYARAGKDIPEEAMKKRNVIVADIELTQYSPETKEASFRVSCSGGLYVRTLCHDAGQMLGCGAAMSALRRVKSGPFSIEQSILPCNAEEIAHGKGKDALPFLPMDSALESLPYITLSEVEAKKFMSGIRCEIQKERYISDPSSRDSSALHECAVYRENKCSQCFIGIGVQDKEVLKPHKVIHENF